MKKVIILSVSLLCLGGVSSCSTLNAKQVSNNDELFIEEVYTGNNSANNSQCTSGESCNNSALVNYAKTEADYREYGERTKRNHLYTQSGTGNNLTASIQPSVEDDIVISNQEDTEISSVKLVENTENLKNNIDNDIFSQTEDFTLDSETEEDDDFSKTASFILETSPVDNDITKDENNQKTENKVTRTVSVVEEIIEENRTNEEIKIASADAEFSVICEEDCEDLFLEGDNNISSEFTEESFDIEEFVNKDDEDINIEQDTDNETLIAELETEVKEVKVTDDTILIWEAKEGDNLRELLTKWSAMSGWKLLWSTNRNYILSAGVTFKGKFADVSSALIRAFARARPAPIATYYKGNRVIVVETMENENAY